MQMFTFNICSKSFISRFYSEFLKFSNKANDSIKMRKSFNQTLYLRRYMNGQLTIQRCLTSLIMRETQ